jgi:hypothetical protein
MSQKKAKKELRNAVRVRIKIEMATPRIAKSARKKYAIFVFKVKRASVGLY